MIKEIKFLGELVLKNLPNIFTIQWKSHLVWIRREISNQAMFSSKNKYISGFWCERTTRDRLLHRRKCNWLWTILVISPQLFLHHKMLIYGLLCGLLWCFYQLFGLVCWWHPFTAKDLQRNFSKSVPIKKQTHVHLGWHGGGSIFSKFSFLGELFL